MSEATARIAERPAESVTPAAARRGTLRAVMRMMWVGAWTAGAGALYAAGRLATWWSARRSVAWHHALIRGWAGGVVRALRIRVAVRGPVPAPPFLLVSNHLGYLDIPVLASVTGTTFVSRHDVRGWPGLGPVARLVGTVFLDRGRLRDTVRAIGVLRRQLDRGIGVSLFPEGTSTAGDRVYPMKSSLLDLPAREGRPVHYCAVSYRTPTGAPPASQLACWWGDMALRPHLLELCRWDGVEATLHFGDEPIVAQDRKALAARLQTEIDRRFHPVES